ncbi:DUF2804 domain-containing protein [Leptospira ilyithenensis]|uniref:DUF2804 domain-containing protein n=1 Tax=Leptospira ilyithenensis TaxID=2484901 RepID=A0A4R9LKS8_9LEPT|nr:DUF2804 domain-containing protein [Leptospira ilyithenensis]TGN06533.1 DUF2804 domain-containing protein [Leptospira ilyithenensis]
MTEIISSLPLHSAKGVLTKAGWARAPYWKYDRAAIQSPKWRIKEWDYYSILSPKQEFGITFTASDLGYAGMFAICFIDLKTGKFKQIDTLSLLPMGKTGFPATNKNGVISYKDDKLTLEFTMKPGKRKIKFESAHMECSNGEEGIEGEIHLAEPKDLESMNIATSWKENRKAFYYNTKINCMPASGGFYYGGNDYSLNDKQDLGALDWGRGVWTYKNRWYWSSASGHLGKKTFGFNLGYGFSDRSPASENVLIYENKIHKLDEVLFHMNTENYMEPWKFTSNDNRLNLSFQPIVDRSSSINLLIMKSVQHQVFGHFNGTVVLDSGKKLELKNFLGFAEDVLNWW